MIRALTPLEAHRRNNLHGPTRTQQPPMTLSAFLHRHLPQVWLRRGPAAWALWPLSWVYGALLTLRRWAYAKGLFTTRRVPALVIVVGNVVAGGAGKTPVTIAVCQHLLGRGLKVGVVSRGHGRRTADTRAVYTHSQPLEVGDEPLLIHQATGAPVWVARARADAALALLQAHPEVQIVLCDDGLQHLALARDIEICVMDARGTGNGWLLPAGPLREAWPRPVDAVLLTEPLVGTLGQGFLSGLASANKTPPEKTPPEKTPTDNMPDDATPSHPTPHYLAPRQLAEFAVRANGDKVPLSTLPHHSLHAVAGLARPEGFFQMLRLAGLQLASTTAMPDHHDYQDWHNTAPGGTWLCTEKDAAKLWPHQADALAVPLRVSPEPAFWQALDARIDRLLPR